jgi:hypothetical protein
MAGSSRERFGDVPSVRTGLGRRERARSLSPSSGRPAIAERTTLSSSSRRGVGDCLGDASIAPMTGAGRLLRHGPTRRGSAVRTIAMRDKRS